MRTDSDPRPADACSETHSHTRSDEPGWPARYQAALQEARRLCLLTIQDATQ